MQAIVGLTLRKAASRGIVLHAGLKHNLNAKNQPI